MLLSDGNGPKQRRRCCNTGAARRSVGGGSGLQPRFTRALSSLRLFCSAFLRASSSRSASVRLEITGSSTQGACMAGLGGATRGPRWCRPLPTSSHGHRRAPCRRAPVTVVPGRAGFTGLPLPRLTGPEPGSGAPSSLLWRDNRAAHPDDRPPQDERSTEPKCRTCHADAWHRCRRSSPGRHGNGDSHPISIHCSVLKERPLPFTPGGGLPGVIQHRRGERLPLIWCAPVDSHLVRTRVKVARRIGWRLPSVVHLQKTASEG